MQPLSKAKLKLFSSLKTRKFRQVHGLCIVEGWKMVSEAQHAGWEVEAVVVREDVIDNALQTVVVQEGKTFSAEKHVFDKMSALESPEGVLAVLHMPEVKASSVVLPQGNGFLLERIQDPGNLGTLLRIADWFGLAGICCSVGTVDVFNPKTLRASMGAIFRVPVFYVEDWEAVLKENTSRIWLADMEGETVKPGLLSKDDWVLLGNEANGLSESTRAILPTRRLSIPGKGEAESLNVAIAGGILGYCMS